MAGGEPARADLTADRGRPRVALVSSARIGGTVSQISIL